MKMKARLIIATLLIALITPSLLHASSCPYGIGISTTENTLVDEIENDILDYGYMSPSLKQESNNNSESKTQEIKPQPEETCVIAFNIKIPMKTKS